MRSQIYPIQKFFGVDNNPETVTKIGKVSVKPTKRYLSLRRFKKALGAAPERFDSGDSQKLKKSGTAIIRKALWQWIFTRIEPRKNRLKNEIGHSLGAMIDEGKQQKQSVSKLRAKCRAKAVEMLFKELTSTL